MPITQKQDDLKEFFAFALRQDATVDSLILSYLNYHGILNFGHQTVMFNALSRALGRVHEGEKKDRKRHQIIGADAEINPGFLADHAPRYVGSYYGTASVDDFPKVTVLPSSKNEWCSDELPLPYNMRLCIAERPAIEIYEARRRQLFVAPYGYQYFDKQSGRYWPAASSRAFARTIEAYPITDVDAPVVILQDQFNASNFSHFLYDYLPRFLRFVEWFPDLAPKSLFLVGGIRGAYQSLFIDILSERCGFDASQFIFPEQRYVWNLRSSLFFFSDQKMTITHPLNMCHPESVRLVRDLIDGSKLLRNLPDRIYIARRDADMRKLRNEDDLARRLSTMGYVDVTLADLDVITQISILANANHIVAPHGMGLTNVLFNRRLASLVEIFNPNIGSDAYAFVCRALGIRYQFCIGGDTQPNKQESYAADIEQVAALA